MIQSISTSVARADTANADILYKNAYNATQNALTVRTQVSVNDARVEIKKLPENMGWAIGEFSKQVDTVQYPILVNIVNSIKKAEKESNQTNINIAKKSIPNELTQTWKNSYSLAVDKIQQGLQEKALDLVKIAESKKTDKTIDEALTVLNDLLLSDSNGIKDWTNSLIFRLNKVVPTTPSEPVPISLIEDKILENEIRRVINKQEGELTKQELLKVKTLDIGGKGIKSLEGLQYCTNLNWINLGGVFNPNIGEFIYNNIEDIIPLSNLTKLTYLDLSFNNIREVGHLSKLTNLKKLNLSNTNITNINGLSNLTQLTYLGLSNNENLSNVNAIKNMKQLQTLGLLYVNLNDDMFNDLKQMNNLKSLLIRNNNNNNDNYVAELRSILINCEIDY